MNTETVSYYFYPYNSHRWTVYNNADRSIAGYLDSATNTIKSTHNHEEVAAAYETFKSSMEYNAFVDMLKDDFNESNYIDRYCNILVAAYRWRAYRCGFDINDATLVDKCIKWLKSTDFFQAPASSRFHESYVGGLVVHTLRVVHNAIMLSDLPKFCNISMDKILISALVHDWCKIGMYESYEKNVKNDATGQWEKQTAFRYKDCGIASLGHGVTSMYVAQRFFRLNIDEANAIRWHMAKWRCVDSEDSELQYANETYPLVHLLQFADQLAIVKY